MTISNGSVQNGFIKFELDTSFYPTSTDTKSLIVYGYSGLTTEIIPENYGGASAIAGKIRGAQVGEQIIIYGIK